tara:strand:+ start:683 stop:1744 length:1062 start_codon:yes stop_codon:yes gene_type:complete
MAYTTIDKPTDYFNTITYTGDNTDRSFTGVGFQPDWVWVKARNNTTWHMLFDAVRGAGVEKELHSNSTQAEGASDNVAYGYINSFDTDGFSTIDGTSSSDALNESGRTYVAWNWLAGGSASSNSNGSITSSVSANTTAGFSIVSYTGTGSASTVGHGLGAVPKMIIIKSRNTTSLWGVYHQAIGNTHGLFLNATNAATSLSAYWNNTSPTSSVFSVGSDADINKSGDPLIAYCFAEKKGYSKFGSYDGNGNADGPFIHTGFKPAWLMIKGYAGTDDWIMMDNKRSGFNSENEYLDANNNSTESDGSGNIDFLSNGFKIKSTFSSLNYSTGEYIYMAFAESPFVNSNGVPTNAR